MSEEFAGRSALVTGGGSGIGLACAAWFARRGATVALMGRDEQRLADGAQAIRDETPGAEVLCFSGDVSEEDAVAKATQATNEAAPLQVVVASAGMGTLAPITLQDADQYDQVMRVNTRGTLVSFKHGGSAIAANGGGAMCAISSIAGLRTHRFMGAYCVSKAAIDAMVRNAADELGSLSVRVNSVCPGLVETELAAGLLHTDAVYQDYLSCMPISRHGVVADIAEAVGFLCSPAATWITGVTLPVDGGHHLRRGPDVSPFAQAMYGEDPLSPK